METSDSECFESADEDFEPEDEFNKNKTSRKDKSIQNLSKNVNTSYNSDINKNNKESKELESQENQKAVQDLMSDIKSIATTEEHEVKTSITVAKNDKTDDKQVNQSDSSKNSNNEDNADDNLWNEGEGWGVDDESDRGDCNLQKAAYSTKTSSDIKILNQKGEKSSKLDTFEQKNMWDTEEEWENWESINEEISQMNSTKCNEESKQVNSISDVDNSNPNSNQLWKGWGNWGVTSILSTASQSVSTLTNSVSQGLSTVLETGIGAPDPEKLAMLNKTEENSLKSADTSSNLIDEKSENKNLLGFGLSNIGNLVSGVSKLVETTSTKVISGGLDTLETIGKKTMEVIQDGDPGLKRKRAFLTLEGEKPVLSHVLREAKEKAEQENKTRQEKHFTRKVNYESIFDDHQGLVHLEALEMLSKQCDMKLQLLIESSSGSALTEIQETLDQVKELCELPDEEEDEQISEDLKDKLKTTVEEIGINITYDKLILMWEETECWLNNLNLNICNENEIHRQAVETLAQLTAIAVEQFHRAGELLLIKDHRSTADEADSLVQLTTTVTSLIGIVAAKFSDKMNSKVTENSSKEDINSLITNIFFEAANSSSYIQDAFQLLVPVLQMGAV